MANNKFRVVKSISSGLVGYYEEETQAFSYSYNNFVSYVEFDMYIVEVLGNDIIRGTTLNSIKGKTSRNFFLKKVFWSNQCTVHPINDFLFLAVHMSAVVKTKST